MNVLSFDIRTMILLLFWGNLASTAILLAYRSRRSARRPVLLFAGAKVVQAAAWLLLAQRGIASDVVSAYLGNSLLFAGFFAETSTVAAIYDPRRGLVALQAALAVAGMAVFCVLARTAREWVAVASLIAALQFGVLIAVMIRWRVRSALGRSLLALYALFVASMVARSALGFTATVTLLMPGLIQSIAFLGVTLVMSLGVVAFILLLKEQQDALLAESEERYRTLVETANDAVTIIQDSRIAFCNGRLARMLGMPAGEIVGRTFTDFISPEDRELVLRNYQARLAGIANPPTYDVRLVDRQGNAIWVLVSGARLVHRGRPAVVAYLADISERVQREAEREHLIGELTQALRDKKVLSGLLPICAGCKKIRDDQGYWTQLEHYVSNHAAVEFSHGLCPECMAKYYPDVDPDSDDPG